MPVVHRIRDDVRVRFIAAATCWSAGMLLLLRSPFGERVLVAPFVGWQTALASRGAAGLPVIVDSSCSASDVLALSAAVMLAYPAAWRRRLAGVALAALWLIALNLVRILTLIGTAGTPLFTPLHVYVWPAILLTAATAFVFTWIWLVEHDEQHGARDVARWRNLVIVTGVLVSGYVIAAPLLLAADALQRGAILMAGAAAWALRALGIEALTAGSTLVVRQSPFLITPECIVSPLMPVYLAAACTWPSRLSVRMLAVTLFLPVFVALGFVRLLTVAMPGLIGPPMFLTHGFYQLLLGTLLVGATAHTRAVAAGEMTTRRLAMAALACTVSVAIGPAYSAAIDAIGRALHTIVTNAPAAPSVHDPQGAVAIMATYQLALLWGLTIAWFGRGGWRIALVLTPVAASIQIAVAAWSRIASTGSNADAVVMRALAVAVPCALVTVAALWRRQRASARAAVAELRA